MEYTIIYSNRDNLVHYAVEEHGHNINAPLGFAVAEVDVDPSSLGYTDDDGFASFPSGYVIHFDGVDTIRKANQAELDASDANRTADAAAIKRKGEDDSLDTDFTKRLFRNMVELVAAVARREVTNPTDEQAWNNFKQRVKGDSR